MIRTSFEWDTIVSDLSPHVDSPIDYPELARFVLRDLVHYRNGGAGEGDDAMSLAFLLEVLHSYTPPE